MFLLLLLPALALAADVRIHHRITGQPWSLRAELHGDHLETIQPYSQLIPPSYAPGARYQLALERPSDKDSNSWDLASVYLVSNFIFCCSKLWYSHGPSVICPRRSLIQLSCTSLTEFPMLWTIA